MDDPVFYHVSTDEVYGSLEEGEYFVEDTPYDPRSPYSASKASSDHFVRAFGNTYGLPIYYRIVLIIMDPINFQRS